MQAGIESLKRRYFVPVALLLIEDVEWDTLLLDTVRKGPVLVYDVSSDHYTAFVAQHKVQTDEELTSELASAMKLSIGDIRDRHLKWVCRGFAATPAHSIIRSFEKAGIVEATGPEEDAPEPEEYDPPGSTDEVDPGLGSAQQEVDQVLDILASQFEVIDLE